jgi:hypothetical protein
MNVIYDILADYKWFRKLMGGTWHLNRYIFDGGTVLFTIWERKYTGDFGGYLTTIKTEKWS